jgi:hypothetical protein
MNSARKMILLTGSGGFIRMAAGSAVVAGRSVAASTASDLVVGAVLLLLSLPRGKVTERFGNWDRYVV